MGPIMKVTTHHILPFVFTSLMGCVGAEADDPADDTSDDSVSETSSAITAPSCVRALSVWGGNCNDVHANVHNGCAAGYTVRLDIPSAPDSSCRYIPPGATVSMSSGCHWTYNGLRSIQRC